MDWQELTKLTGGRPIVVERVRLAETDIAIEGKFELPPLVRLSMEDQVFVAAFVRTHGSIKDMEKLFGVSYPTIKNRLAKIASAFEFIEVDAAPSKSEVIERLQRGEISAKDAVALLKDADK